MLSDQIAWETYFNALQNQERYLVTNPRTMDVLGGSEALAFRQAAWVWDEVVPDVKNGADVVDSIGTVSKSTVFFINSEAMVWKYDAQTNFITTEFVRPVGQDARTAEILWMGAIGTNNRRKLGVLKSISQSLT
jgi:hypothetical protein